MLGIPTQYDCAEKPFCSTGRPRVYYPTSPTPIAQLGCQRGGSQVHDPIKGLAPAGGDGGSKNSGSQNADQALADAALQEGPERHKNTSRNKKPAVIVGAARDGNAVLGESRPGERDAGLVENSLRPGSLSGEFKQRQSERDSALDAGPVGRERLVCFFGPKASHFAFIEKDSFVSM